jgi:hypothetical protein
VAVGATKAVGSILGERPSKENSGIIQIYRRSRYPGSRGAGRPGASSHEKWAVIAL